MHIVYYCEKKIFILKTPQTCAHKLLSAQSTQRRRLLLGPLTGRMNCSPVMPTWSSNASVPNDVNPPRCPLRPLPCCLCRWRCWAVPSNCSTNLLTPLSVADLASPLTILLGAALSCLMAAFLAALPPALTNLTAALLAATLVSPLTPALAAARAAARAAALAPARAAAMAPALTPRRARVPKIAPRNPPC